MNKNDKVLEKITKRINKAFQSSAYGKKHEDVKLKFSDNGEVYVLLNGFTLHIIPADVVIINPDLDKTTVDLTDAFTKLKNQSWQLLQYTGYIKPKYFCNKYVECYEYEAQTGQKVYFRSELLKEYTDDINRLDLISNENLTGAVVKCENEELGFIMAIV